MASININYLFPLSLGENGYFQTNKTVEAATKQNIKSVLLTRKGERVCICDFGTSILDMLFDPKTPELKAKIQVEGINAIHRWVPNVKINNFYVLFNEDVGVGSPLYGKIILDEYSTYVVVSYDLMIRDGITITDSIGEKIGG